MCSFRVSRRLVVSRGRVFPDKLGVQSVVIMMLVGAKLCPRVVGGRGPERERWVHTEKVAVGVLEVPTGLRH